MISQPAPTVCPVCNKDDRIQRSRAYPNPRLAPPVFVEAPKPVWAEPNKPLRLLLVSLLALAVGLLIVGATQGDSGGASGFMLGGGAALAAAALLLAWMRSRRQTARLQYEWAVAAWGQRMGAERQRWSVARTRWENDLFYCHRDDVVFFRGSPAVRPEQMGALLY
jgi:hypothetical protein